MHQPIDTTASSPAYWRARLDAERERTLAAHRVLGVAEDKLAFGLPVDPAQIVAELRAALGSAA
jgi:hypothetical protein